jgi:hypothetical protein
MDYNVIKPGPPGASYQRIDENNKYFRDLAQALGFKGEGADSYDAVLRRAKELQRYANKMREVLDRDVAEDLPQILVLADTRYVVVNETQWDRLLKKLGGEIP